jgi:hypothetical protein
LATAKFLRLRATRHLVPNTLALSIPNSRWASIVLRPATVRFIAIGAITLAAIGCQSSAGLAPVSGKITLDGKPLAAAHVVFQPESSGKSPSTGGSYAFTNENGEYTLRSFEGDQAGAAVGTHKVQINLKVDSESDSPSRTRPKPLPPRYNVQTELTFQVQPGGTKEANFDLTSKP